MSIEFVALHLLVDEESPSPGDLEPLFSTKNEKFCNYNTHYLIEIEKLKNGAFWIYARYGRSTPYSNTVYNTKDQIEENNPRSTHQIEPLNQYFALYCIKSHTLYLSKRNQKSAIKEYLKKKLQKDVVIKNFYTDTDEFIQQINTVEKIKLVTKKNLLTANGEILKIFKNPNDLFGLGMPEEFILEANFAKVKKTKYFIKIFKEIVGLKNRNEADSLVCIGRDDNNFETVFNVDSFTQKVTFEATKDDLGLYNPTTIKQKLLESIGVSD